MLSVAEIVGLFTDVLEIADSDSCNENFKLKNLNPELELTKVNC